MASLQRPSCQRTVKSTKKQRETAQFSELGEAGPCLDPQQIVFSQTELVHMSPCLAHTSLPGARRAQVQYALGRD